MPLYLAETSSPRGLQTQCSSFLQISTSIDSTPCHTASKIRFPREARENLCIYRIRVFYNALNRSFFSNAWAKLSQIVLERLLQDFYVLFKRVKNRKLIYIEGRINI